MMNPLLKTLVTSALFSTTILQASAEERVMLKEPDPKIALRIETSTVVKGGEAESAGPGGTVREKIDITRERLMQRTMTPDAIGGEVSYRILKDSITTSLNGKVDTKTGPLEGKTATARLNGAGNWTFSLSGIATGDAVQELSMLEGIENRRWLPGREVAVGESWNFSPNFIRRSLQRDFPHPQVSGLMKLRKVEKKSDGTRQAIIDCFIRAGSSKVLDDGEVIDAETGLVGSLTVNLDRPGLMRIYLSGKLNTGASKDGETARAVMPLNMSAKFDPMPSVSN
ncbi:hypothetical protein [Haloferula sp.]|uniref:hypothetical protein n=1 Tax=Haloferula sp. TaxID=2497595 RepID=UPI003C76BCE1